MNEQIRNTHRYKEHFNGCSGRVLKGWVKGQRNLEAQIGCYRIVMGI